MNIVLLTSEYHTEAYRAAGMSQAMGKLAHWMADHGHRVHVVLQGKQDATTVERPGIKVHRFQTRPHLNWRVRALGYRILPAAWRERLWFHETAETAADIIGELRSSGECDVVISSSTLAQGLLKRRDGPPVVARLQHPWLRCLRAEFRRPTAETWVNARREQYVARHATRVYAPSRAGAANYHDLRHEEIPVIRTPMFPLGQPESWTAVRERYQLPENFVLFFGGLLGTKGAHVLAEALPAFMSGQTELALVACGRVSAAPDGGKMDEFMRRKAGVHAKRLTVLPAMDHAALFALIRQSRFVVLPSVLDNLPNALLEAMWFGKLVVASRGASLDEVLDDGVDGLLFTMDDPADLAAVMLKACHMAPSSIAEIGQRAAEKARRLFDPDRVVGQVIDLCQSAISEHNDAVSASGL